MVRRTVDEELFAKQNVDVVVAPVVRHVPALIEEELNPGGRGGGAGAPGADSGGRAGRGGGAGTGSGSRPPLDDEDNTRPFTATACP
ncbi:MAG: hypothetical protein WDO73_31015 [Ignavibacteriota bacterium]